MAPIRRSLNNLVPAGRSQGVQWTDAPVTTWRRFHSRVSHRDDLLCELPRFNDPILVAGCQRSGTTLLSRLVSRAPGMVPFSFSYDDELDAACLLAGLAHLSVDPAVGRYCFQTTYLDDHYPEYSTHQGNFKLLWVVRNPFSVVWSMVHNWRPQLRRTFTHWPPSYSLNALFRHCGHTLAPETARKKFLRPWPLGLSKLEQAVYSYAAKTSQVLSLRQQLPDDQLMVLEYDDLILRKDTLLPTVFQWLDLPYNPAIAQGVSSKALNKADALSTRERTRIEQVCMPVYKQAASLCKRF